MAATPYPQLLRAPGLGLALLDVNADLVTRAYPFIGTADDCRALAVAFARALGDSLSGPSASPPAAAGSPLLAEMLEDWLAAGGARSTPALADRPAPFKSAGVDPVAGNLCAPHADKSAIDWRRVELGLLAQGLTLRQRGQDNESMVMAGIGDFTVFEFLDTAGKVTSEGKGATREAALTSAIGEAVERLVAQAPSDADLWRSTDDQLQASEIARPLLTAEAADLFCAQLPMEWILARTFDGVWGAMPAELAYYPFASRTGVRAFATQHTAGLAAGGSPHAAAIAGLRECIETDAYWRSMRTKQVCGLFGNLEDAGDAPIASLVRKLAQMGIRVWAGSIAFDWPLPIAHVVLETKGESLPALSHGLGAGGTWREAVERALHEAIQVYSGLEKVSLQYWQDVSVQAHRTAEAAIVWSNPGFSPRILEPFRNAPPLDLNEPFEGLVTDVQPLIGWMKARELVAWTADLGVRDGLHVARTFLEGGVSAFSERGAPSTHLMDAVHRAGLTYPYLDPILT